MINKNTNCNYRTESKNTKVVKTKTGIIMLLSKCSVCNSKNSKFLKEQEAKRLSSKLTGIKIPVLSDLPILKAFLKNIKRMQ